ncbi:MAG TPA: DUF3300 domain-containing protein [Gemmatimonadaceae bacterium]|nr:DUF3300 domain-containing protein [Gemmatimonadaceae bacterium]
MTRRTFALLAAVSLAAASAVATPAIAQESRPSTDYVDEDDGFSGEELDNLVGPVALYPDALLAQVLVASTFPEQVLDAARYVRENGDDGIDDQSWDVSVKAVAHYPSALNMLAEKEDWMTALGRAYALQSGDVMSAVQRLRRMADTQGNLRSTPQQVVSRDAGDYVIVPAQPRVIHVPVYDPYVVYTRPVFALNAYSSFWSFGVGFPIGAWLNYDFNWPRRVVYYHGWEPSYYGYSSAWRVRSRPFIRVTNIYINPRYRNVYVNRDVIRRRVVYRNVDRYPGVHRTTYFGYRDQGLRGADRARYVPDRTPYRGSSIGGYARSRGGSAVYDGYRSGNRNDDRGVYRGNGNGSRNDDRDRGGVYDRSRSGVYDRSRNNRNDNGNGNGSIGGYGREGVTYTPGPGSRVYDRSGGSNAGDGSRGNDRTSGSSERSQGPRLYDRSGGMRDGGGSGSWGRDRSQGEASRPPREARPDFGGQADRQRGGDRGGNGGEWQGRGRGGESGAIRGPQRNDGPMINPRRAESRGQGGDQGGGRGNGGNGGGNGRGGNGGGRERPKV